MPDLERRARGRHAATAETTPEGEWIVLVGFNETNLLERRGPDRQELDRVAPRHPVLLIHFTYHEGVLNSLGLRAAGLDALAADPPGGMIGRTATGAANGRVYERCFGAAESVARQARLAADREQWFRIANGYQERVLAAGITHVCDAAVPASMEALYREWRRRGELHVGVTMMPLAENMFAVPTERLDGAATGWSDGRLSLGALKLFTDGGTKCAICITLHDAIRQFAAMLGRTLRHRSLTPWRLALQQPAHYGADRRLHTGLLYYDEAALAALVKDGLRPRLLGRHPRRRQRGRSPRRSPRSPPPTAAPRCRRASITSSSSRSRRCAAPSTSACTSSCSRCSSTTPDRCCAQTGLPASLAYQAHRQMLDAGLVLAASSDAPVFTFDVIAAIDTAVRRRTADGSQLGADQAIAAADALRMYTRGAAAVLGMEGEIGVLRPGARADAVVLSEDPAAVPSDRLREIGVTHHLRRPRRMGLDERQRTTDEWRLGLCAFCLLPVAFCLLSFPGIPSPRVLPCRHAATRRPRARHHAAHRRGGDRPRPRRHRLGGARRCDRAARRPVPRPHARRGGGRLRRTLRKLGKPLLATVRWSAEGGSGALTDAQRLALYEALAPHADALDVELRSPLCDDVVALGRRHQRLTIVSAHFFDATPPLPALRDLLAEGAPRADIVKIATATRDTADLGVLVDLLRLPGPPRIVIGMGAIGAATRVFFPLLDSLLTYSFAGAPTAPGQIALAPLYDAMREYSPAFAASHPARARGTS